MSTVPTVPARVTAHDALVIYNRHLIDSETATNPVAREESMQQARYWRGRADACIAKSKPVKRGNSNRFHAYTHDAEGNRVRLG